jgi:hypothetical protein
MSSTDSLLPKFFQRWRDDRRSSKKLAKQERLLAQWESDGRPAPVPHLIKQKAILAYARKFNIKTLVETGTYRGDMVDAMRKHFDRIYSIELSQPLFEKARDRFRLYPHIEIIQGDSGAELGKLIKQINTPAIFWLDGHYSAGFTAKGEKETPIYEELSHLFSAPDINHVILIDDARCFGEDKDYPTIDELKKFVLSNRPGSQFNIENDCIHIYTA